MKKKISIILAALLAVSSFAACGDEDSDTTTAGGGNTTQAPTTSGGTGTGTGGADTTAGGDSTTAPGGSDSTKTSIDIYNETAAAMFEQGEFAGITLNVSTTFAGSDNGARDWLNRRQAFADRTGVAFNDTSATSTPESNAAVTKSFDDGAEPDVLFYFLVAHSDPFRDKLATIDEIKAIDSEYGSNYNMDKVPASSDNKKYALPENYTIEGLFYNNKILTDAGVDIEATVGKAATYTAFKESITKIKASSKEGIAANMVSEPHYWFEWLILNEEEDPLTEHRVLPADANDAAGKRWVAAFTELKALYEGGYFISDAGTVANTDAAKAKFYDGTAAYYTDGQWARSGVAASNAGVAGDVKIGYIGGAKGRLATDIPGGATSGWMISKKGLNDTAKQKAVVGLVKFLTDTDVLGVVGNMQGNSHALNTDLPAPANADVLFADWKAMVDGLTNIIIPAGDLFPNGALFSTGDSLYKVVTGAVTAETAVNNAIAD